MSLAAGPAAPEPLHTPGDVAKALNVSRNTVYTLVQRGELRALRIGGQLRIAPAELKRYLAEAARAS